jgi:hypothetical protein
MYSSWRKWCDIYKILKNKNILIDNFWKILEYFLAISGTNAIIERIFSITNISWTNEKKSVFNLTPVLYYDLFIL